MHPTRQFECNVVLHSELDIRTSLLYLKYFFVSPHEDVLVFM
jgi:hypothetical protein